MQTSTRLNAKQQKPVLNKKAPPVTARRWVPPTEEVKAQRMAQRDVLEAARKKREAAYAASNPKPIMFEGDPSKATVWYPGHGRKPQAEHEQDAKDRFEKWEREKHPVRAGLRAFNDELATFARKHLNPAGILSGILPEPSGLHKDHPIHQGAKYIAPVIGTAMDAATGLGGSEMPHEDHEEPARMRSLTKRRRVHLAKYMT